MAPGLSYNQTERARSGKEELVRRLPPVSQVSSQLCHVLDNILLKFRVLA